jgi:D-arabinose 1-dehydrogenase-like Zn-dependent alcohol dehydrogenase
VCRIGWILIGGITVEIETGASLFRHGSIVGICCALVELGKCRIRRNNEEAMCAVAHDTGVDADASKQVKFSNFVRAVAFLRSGKEPQI